jgi:hypothetical protein
VKKSTRHSSGKPLKIWKNAKRREKLKSEKATLLDGSCCWTITGSQGEKIVLSHSNPVPQVDFYVRKVMSHKCNSQG